MVKKEFTVYTLKNENEIVYIGITYDFFKEQKMNIQILEKNLLVSAFLENCIHSKMLNIWRNWMSTIC